MEYETKYFLIKEEPHSLPWVIIFPKEKYKELSDMPKALYQKLFELVYIVEKTLKEVYSPDKINVASFGNVLPQVHIHIMARYEDDSHFPNPLWGAQLRAEKKVDKDFKKFFQSLQKKLQQEDL